MDESAHECAAWMKCWPNLGLRSERIHSEETRDLDRLIAPLSTAISGDARHLLTYII